MNLKFLDRKQASSYLKEKGIIITKHTLEKMACVGGGPLYQKFGTRVVYTPENLDAWVMEKLSPPKRSTSSAV